MKPRRLLLSVNLLPTISETHEDTSRVLRPGHHSQSLEDYVASIKELAQPAAFSACAPLLAHSSPGPRLTSFPLAAKHPGSAAPPCATARACKPCLPVTLDNITLTFAADTKRDCSGSLSNARDPLDWLFAQTECGELSLTGNTSAALCLL
ncbi:hypothetical protein SKAU_G00146060 [Synaphobranchus kaupii]|uniref:Uncharacterized protein n=1 Tax=Synaphobranchus kaupii TaxID=118154 RepID=A0A9Q1FU55_SYNKA|nr:hypothetical protein SKAU_G00146060 [Synaphobranchus kaupii]